MAMTRSAHVAEETLSSASPAEFSARVAPVVPQMSLLASRFAGHDERDDVVQDALLKAWAKRGQFDPTRGTLRVWLLAITANEARKRKRPNASRPAVTDVGSADSESRIDIERALTFLTVRERQAVDCYYFAGLSVDETATVMTCSSGTVKSTLSSARARMRKLLGEPK
jgi:RNA polymerase sigma factor (sigma-70 family)